METITSKLVVLGILFLFTLVSGLIVSRSGRPFSIGLVTVHKFAAVGTMVLIYLSVSPIYKAVGGNLMTEFFLLALSAVMFLALIATGAFLTREEMDLPAFVLKIHQVAPLLALAFTSLTIMKFVNLVR